MEFIRADNLSLTCFCLFSAFMYVMIQFALKHVSGHQKWILGFRALIIISSILTMLGLVKDYFVPVGPLIVFITLGFGLAFSFSQLAGLLAQRLSLVSLIGFQSFRLPLELILHQWAELGTVPTTMTWTGSNWDIIAGAAALLSIPLVKKNAKAAWVPQIIGFVLLLNVLRVVALSSPLPFSWPLENPLQLILYFPYSLILPLFVMPALVGHILTFRKLLNR